MDNNILTEVLKSSLEVIKLASHVADTYTGICEKRSGSCFLGQMYTKIGKSDGSAARSGFRDE